MIPKHYIYIFTVKVFSNFNKYHVDNQASKLREYQHIWSTYADFSQLLKLQEGLQLWFICW